MTTLTIEISDEDSKLLKQLLKKLDAKIVSSGKSLYDPKFVVKIKKGERDLKEGKGVKLDINNLWK